jgi:hypothetical protein
LVVILPIIVAHAWDYKGVWEILNKHVSYRP